jgi:deazaflavin-dependent oxidoreductase (nitroreductase family)
MAQTKMNKTLGSVFAALHKTSYKLTGGKIGGSMVGGSIIVLGTIGAKTGKARETPLIGGTHDDGWIVIASWSGHDLHPGWFHNLQVSPDATVQLGKQKTAVRARVAEGVERDELWARMVDVYAGYDEYEAVTDRTIPVVVLERT